MDPTKLNDKEKLVTLFAGLNDDNSGSRGIERKILPSLIFLIEKDVNDSFMYNFNVRTNPFSDDLEEDLDDLLRAQLLEMRSTITITTLGRDWYNSFGENASCFLDKIKEILAKLANTSYSGLQELVYLKLTK